MARSLRTKSAFTLIELLVVIAVIALLISLLLPTLASSRESARLANCLGNTRSIGQALSMYADQSKSNFPHWSGWQLWEGDGTGGDAAGPAWTELLRDHVESREVFRDPSRPRELAPFSYFLQARFTYGQTSRAYTSLSLASVQFPTEFVLAGDCNNRVLYSNPYGSTNNQPDCDQDDATQPAVFFTDLVNPELFAHRGGRSESATGKSNLLFLDSHVATFSRFEPSRMTWHGSRFSDWASAI
jgi:prepilin-type N-terminal cleavage/methylation domain-containing protein/prepilin-type processing-associated H-X9-DG protein